MIFSKRSFRRLGGLSLGLLLCAGALAQTAPDADLYYRRTHGGAAPPPGIDPSDHSGETTDVVSAESLQLPKSPQSPLPMGLLDNGVDPANLGKGDWIWQMPATETRLGVATVQGVIDYEKSMGMKWITVKCGDSASIYTQFSSDLITRAHAAGLKIFGWAYVYGSNPSGEASVALNALNLGADGFIIDAEGEYEVLANNSAVAAQYCQAIRAVYPTRFMAHAPFPYISYHSGFPYVTFGVYCDAVMPQDYWGAIGITPTKMITDMDSQWRTWQNALTGTNRNAIKPIVPLAQSYAPVTGAEITTFVNGIKSDATPATTGGYQGISFWDAQERTADMDAAVLAASIGLSNNPAYLLTQPLLSRTAETGGTVSFSASTGGSAPISYQWRLNGGRIAGATNASYSLTNAQSTNTGNYTIAVTNLYGGATSAPVSMTVYPPQAVVFSDSFDADTTANWTVSKSSADARITFNYDYSANGIASAPHSTGGTMLGVKLEANLTAGVIAALSMSPIGQSFSGDYRLHFDMWINVNGPFPGGGSSSTEFLTAGIGTAGNRVQWTGTGTTADGYWFSADGEGGVSDTSTTSGDYCAYIGTALQNTNTGIYAAGTNANPRGNLNNYYVSAFPGGLSAPALQQSTYAQQTGALSAGTVGFAWHDVIVSRRGTTVEWSIDGIKLATISNATFGASNIVIGYWDPFASLTDNTNLSFGLVDNVRVEAAIVAPAIAAQPQSRTVNQGSNVVFTVTASGTPAPAYQWTFKGTNINGAVGSSYTRLNAQLADAGTYAVIVTNAGGSLTSSNALLTVNVPPAITAQPQSQTVIQGSNVVFTVTASGTPAPAYQWTFKGTNINGAVGSSYTRLNAQLADAGTYAVVLTNAGGSLTSSNAVLTVNVPPTITTQPQSQTVTQGSNVVFTVTASGTPAPAYQWTFNGTNIAAATGSSFTRLGSQVADAGTYTVAVTNIAGAVVSSNAVLMVAVPLPPHFDLISLLPDQRVDVWLSGSTGIVYVIEASTNLFDWAPLATLTNTSGAFEFIDNPATNAQRLYRARLGP